MKTSFPVILCLLLAWCGDSCAGPALRADSNATVVLILEQGQAPLTPGQRESRDLELELTRLQGKWLPEVWGYALWFSRTDHEGRIVKMEEQGQALRLEVSLTLTRDRWSQGGAAEYQLELEQRGGKYAGQYRGSFRGTAVTGKVTGTLLPCWKQPVSGFKPLRIREHPRLIFRRDDLPEMRRRMRLPEGKAIQTRFRELLDQNISIRAKTRPMYAAGCGLAYQLTGDRTHAQTARQFLLEKVLDQREGLVQDIHFGPYALAVALAFDFCCDAWDPEFRTRIVDWLQLQVRYLLEGAVDSVVMSGFNSNPWSNHNGIRTAAAGVAALAILGEKGSGGQELPELEKWITLFARDLRRYFVYGLGETGWCMEGDFYKRMTWNAGPGHFLQACRTALGLDLLQGLPGAYTLTGEWMQLPPSDDRPSLPVGDDQDSGLWPLGWITVPRAHLAGVRWLYDRTFGLAGDKTFGIAWAYQAAYVLVNYPFDIPSRYPGEVIPWAAPDLRKGHYLFRHPWRSQQDFLTLVHLKSEVMRGCHYERAGEAGELQIWGLGRQWVKGVSLIEAGIRNSFLGGKTTFFEYTPEGTAILSVCLDDIYLEEKPSRQRPAKEAEKGPVSKPGEEAWIHFPRAPMPFADHGIRGQRHLAIDYSGMGGAPALFVFVDVIQGAANPIWMFPLAREAGPVAMKKNCVIIGDPSGINMKGTFIAPANVQLEGALTASGGQLFYAVFTIQKGSAPTVQVQGSNWKSTVVTGNRTIHFDGKKLFLGKTMTAPAGAGSGSPTFWRQRASVR
jgi:hypothetical protein